MGKTDKTDLLQGTLDMLILKSLQLEPMHGFGLSVRIRQISNEVLQVEQGSLYPALFRLEEQSWISSEWGTTENNRKAKYYSLTAKGRKQLQAETANWENHWIEFDIGTGTLALTDGFEHLQPGGSGALVAFEMPDLDAFGRHLAALGLKWALGPFDTPVCTCGTIKDPEGNEIMIHRRK